MIDYDYIIESLKKQRERLVSDYGDDSFVSNVNILEISLISLCNRLVNMADVDAELFRNNLSVVAIGDFGRGFVGVNQDVSLLFVVEDVSVLREEWIREIVNPLIEVGWRIKHRLVTISEIFDEMSQNRDFVKELASFRYVSGSRAIVDKLENTVKKWFSEQGATVIGELKRSWVDRLEKALGSSDWLELDVLEFAGGLEDVRNIRLGLRCSGIWSDDEAIKKGIIDRQDVDRLNQIEKFYLRLINAIGGFQLSYASQEEVASRLGYTAKGSFSSVEVFMREVYRAFYDVNRICQLFWGQIFYSPSEGREVNKGIFIREGSLDVDFNVFELNPVNFVKIFRISAQYGVPVGSNTLKHLMNHKNVLESFAGDRSVSEELLHMIHADNHNLMVFRQFHDMGFLSAVIPEWDNFIGVNQHDVFHGFPFHEHALRTLSEVKKVLDSHYINEEVELTKVGSRISDPRWLYLASLLHDIGKPAGKGHALKGGEMIPHIARRLGLLPEESDMVQFLVAQHTLLMDSASMRDVGDEGMLSQCTLIIGNPIRLDYLLILTFADLKATGPIAFEKWQRSPIIFLYERLSQIIEKGEPNPALIRERIAQIKNLVKEKVSDLMDETQLQNQLEEVSPRYLLSITPEEIANHLRLEWNLLNSKDPFTWNVTPSASVKYRGSVKGWIFTLVSEMSHGLLYKVAGVLTLNNVDIVSAQVFVKKSGITILDFHCVPRVITSDIDWQSITSDLRKLLDRKISIDYRLALRAIFPRTARPSESEMVVDNDSSDDYTIFEIYTRDRPGLLYLITKVFASFDIKVYVAKITTRGNKVADVFYVRDHLDNKITDPEQIEEIKNAVVFWLDHASIVP